MFKWFSKLNQYHLMHVTYTQDVLMKSSLQSKVSSGEHLPTLSSSSEADVYMHLMLLLLALKRHSLFSLGCKGACVCYQAKLRDFHPSMLSITSILISTSTDTAISYSMYSTLNTWHDLWTSSIQYQLCTHSLAKFLNTKLSTYKWPQKCREVAVCHYHYCHWQYITNFC